MSSIFKVVRRLETVVATLLVIAGQFVLAADDVAEVLDRYERYALSNEGDPVRGERLFAEHQDLACHKCHRVTGLERSGPNLDGVGDKFSRRELVRQILYPNEQIKPGFEQTVIVKTDGTQVAGRIERTTREFVRIIDGTGKQSNVKTVDIDELAYAGKSLMPENIATTISPQQFADLVAWLETLKFGVKSGLMAGGKQVPIPRLDPPVRFVPINSAEMRFENPVWCGAIPGVSGQLLVIEHQSARIWRYIPGNEPRKELFLDLGSEIYFSANQGLMCLAFHPDFRNNGRYFLEYEVKEPVGDQSPDAKAQVRTTIVERRATDDRLRDSGAPSKRLLAVNQPAFNHNGGCIAFGKDGMLYAAFGDGGPQRDPPGFSQNARELLGSMIRIDVDQSDGDRPYGIPQDNPFLKAHQQDERIRPETWAIGFREPWRFSFDSVTGDLLLGDVGQDKFEEVCLVRRGENHGWNVIEAFTPFSEEYRRDGEEYVEPIFAYEHGLGFSITGGHVYRADRQSSFYGVYVFGDYNTRRVWGLRHRNGELLDVREIGTAPGGIASFGIDDRGEIMLVTYDGMIYHVDFTSAKYD